MEHFALKVVEGNADNCVIFHFSAFEVEKVVGLTGFVIIHVLIASFSPAQGERNQMVIAKFTRLVNAMPMSTLN